LDSAPDPTGGAHSTPPDYLAAFKRFYRGYVTLAFCIVLTNNYHYLQIAQRITIARSQMQMNMEAFSV